MASVENLTIMFTDIEGFSELVANLPRTVSKNILQIHDRILSRVIKNFGGNTIKSIGDSFLVTFRSPTDAVLCGMAMHDALWDANKNNDLEIPLAIRVSLNAGEVRLSNHDVFGEAVNIASRLEKITPTNAVYLTEAVYLSMSKSEVNLEKIDSFQFKGITDKVNVYQARHKPLEHVLDTASNPDDICYPYGGAHIHHKPEQTSHHTGKSIILTCSLIVVLFSTWWSTLNSPEIVLDKIPVEYTNQAMSESVQEVATLSDDSIAVTNRLKNLANPLLEAGDYLGLERIITDNNGQYTNNAYLQLITAHTDVYFKRYSSAVSNYHKAFDSNSSFAEEELAVKNLMLLLEQERVDASRLIAQNMNSKVIQKLGERTGQPGLTGRYDAFYLLKDSGNGQSIDRVGLNIQDLRELDNCKMKKTAVIELKRLADERSLEALKESINVGPLGMIKYSCLRKEARRAIELIEAKS